MVRLEGLCKLKKKSNDQIGIQTRNLPACSIVSQPTTLPHAPTQLLYQFIIHILVVTAALACGDK
jgi:hypothetical protein